MINMPKAGGRASVLSQGLRKVSSKSQTPVLVMRCGNYQNNSCSRSILLGWEAKSPIKHSFFHHVRPVASLAVGEFSTFTADGFFGGITA
jgi:hypothetical protein